MKNGNLLMSSFNTSLSAKDRTELKGPFDSTPSYMMHFIPGPKHMSRLVNELLVSMRQTFADSPQVPGLAGLLQSAP